MEIAALILIMLGLSASCFSIALNSSIYRCIEWGETFRISVVFSFIQVVMSLLGWLVGHALNGWLKEMSFPVAILILFFIGARLILESRQRNPEHRIIMADDLKWIIGFAFLTSINTFLIGISLGIMTEKVYKALAILFALVFINIVVGVRLGKIGTYRLGKFSETTGGVILMAISAIVLLQYLKII